MDREKSKFAQNIGQKNEAEYSIYNEYSSQSLRAHHGRGDSETQECNESDQVIRQTRTVS